VDRDLQELTYRATRFGEHIADEIDHDLDYLSASAEGELDKARRKLGAAQRELEHVDAVSQAYARQVVAQARKDLHQELRTVEFALGKARGNIEEALASARKRGGGALQELKERATQAEKRLKEAFTKVRGAARHD
jgi:ElaB/YqjD/DUF883 family membrane-anchored ribosome-binding protein